MHRIGRPHTFCITFVNQHILLLRTHPHIDEARCFLAFYDLIKVVASGPWQESVVIIVECRIELIALLFSKVGDIIAFYAEATLNNESVSSRHRIVSQWALIELEGLESILVRVQLSRSDFHIRHIVKLGRLNKVLIIKRT